MGKQAVASEYSKLCFESPTLTDKLSSGVQFPASAPLCHDGLSSLMALHAKKGSVIKKTINKMAR